MKKERLDEKLEIAKKHAISKNGQCLSNEYINNSLHMIWKCSNTNHKPWTASYKKVVNCGTWCTECRNERLSFNSKGTIKQSFYIFDKLATANNHSKNKQGRCITAEYCLDNKYTENEIKEFLKRQNNKYTWKCSNPEHKEWNAKVDAVIKLNSWCPECGKEQRAKSLFNSDGLLIAKEHAKNKGGECLSKEYVSSSQHLIWKCEHTDHKEWKASYDQILRLKTWCPECGKRTIAENRVRLFFEIVFGKSFPSVRPEWNINPWTNKNLELDGYCKEINIAFEYDGEHHYQINSLDKNSKKRDFIYQQFKDEQKKKNCLKNNVQLINIPFLSRHYINDVDVFIKNIEMSALQIGLEIKPTKEQIEQFKNRF